MHSLAHAFKGKVNYATIESGAPTRPPIQQFIVTGGIVKRKENNSASKKVVKSTRTFAEKLAGPKLNSRDREERHEQASAVPKKRFQAHEIRPEIGTNLLVACAPKTLSNSVEADRVKQYR